MARFKVGERVEYHEKPNDCGTIVKILSEGEAGALYAINWDNHPDIGELAEAALVPCGWGDASGNVLKVLCAQQPLFDHEIADILKARHDAEAVHRALLFWQEKGEAMQDADGRWLLTH